MMELGLLIPRVIIGLLFVGHGSQKLFGWFGGHGLTGTARFFDQIGIRPARLFALIVGLFEVLGGLGLALGFLTPLAAAMLAGVMLGAIAFVHWPKGLWNANGGIEYNLVIIAASALYGLAGAGEYALDAYLGTAFLTPEIYGLGFVVSLLVTLLLRLIADRQSMGRTTAQATT